MATIYDRSTGRFIDPENCAREYTWNGPGGGIDSDTCIDPDTGARYKKTFLYTGVLLTGETLWVKQ